MKHGLPKIKDMEPGDFKNNDYLLRMAEKLNRDGAGIVLGTLDDLINWGRSNSLWSLTFGTSCCAIEFMALGAARYDMARFGFEVTRNSPRQADMIMVLGTITYRMAPVLKRLYDQMAEPKYVVAAPSYRIFLSLHVPKKTLSRKSCVLYGIIVPYSY